MLERGGRGVLIRRALHSKHEAPAPIKCHNGLEELVPGYIAVIPSTGFGGHPAWSYEARPFVDHPAVSGLYGENPWALNLYVADRPVSSDRMLYLPNLRYPSTATRIGEWARVHY